MKAPNGSTRRFIESLPDTERLLGPDDHILWPFAKRPNGYGSARDGRRMVNAHRVVLERKLGRPLAAGMQACHVITCVSTRLCVRPSHLYEGSGAENAADREAQGRTARGDTHGSRTKRSDRPRGSAHGLAKLTEDGVRSIKSRLAAGDTSASIARDYGVTPSTIGSIKLGRCWVHV